MNTSWNRFCFVIGLLTTPLAVKAATTVNFDSVPSGTIINNIYADVQFSLVNGNGTNVYAANAGAFAASAPNVVSPFPSGMLPFFDRRNGGIQATFANPQSTVSIDAAAVLPPEYFGTPINKPFLQAFDANNNFIGIAYYPLTASQANYGSYQTLTIHSSTANIKYVQFSSQNGNGSVAVYGEFDNLTYNNDYLVTLPAAPSELRVIKFGRNALAIRWMNNAANATSVKVYRSINNLRYALIATLAPGVTTYTNTGLTANTTYFYKVYAYNTAGFSPPSNTLQTMTLR